MTVTVLAYFMYKSPKDAGPTASLNGLRNIMILTALAYLLYQTLKIKGARPIADLIELQNIKIATVLAYIKHFESQYTHRLDKKMIVTVPTYLNYLQNQTTEDEGPFTKYYVLRNINNPKTVVLIYGLEKKMVTKQNDVTQAGSDCSFKVSDPRANSIILFRGVHFLKRLSRI